MGWFTRRPEGGADDPSNFKAPSDEPKDKSRRNFMKVVGLGAGALAVESLVPKEVQAALDPQKKKEAGEASSLERGRSKGIEVKGIPDAATAAEVKAMIDAFLQNPQIKFKGAPGTRPVGGPLTLEFVGVSQGLADMGEVRRQGKQSAESEIIRSTGSMGNTANTGTIAGRAEQVGERIAGSIIGGILRKQSDKVLGHPEGDMAITFKVQTGRARGEVSTHTTTVRYAINERTGKISLGHVREGARELPGSGPTAEKYTSGSQELNSAAIKKAVEAAIADARADGPIKSYLALELMMYATAPAPSEQRTELRPTVSENSSMQATPRAERSPDGMVPMHGARQPEVQRVPEAEAPKAAEKPAPRILPVNRRNNQ